MNHNRENTSSGDAWEKRLRAISAPPPPDGLLPRCLDTIDSAAVKAFTEQPAFLQEPSTLRAAGRRPLAGSRRKWIVSIAPLAAAVLIGMFFFWGPQGTENLLAQVIQALDRAAAYHVRATVHLPGPTDGPSEKAGGNTIEMWVVRGVGRRTENRLNEKLVSVVVENPRWKLLWNPDARRVSAWPSVVLDAKTDWPLEEFTVSREKIIEWAEKQKATVVPQACGLDGRKAEKVTLTWPAESGAGRLSVWFEADSRRPIKLAYEKLDGTPQMEATIDYPPAEAVPQERFAFPVPRDAELEVFDPQFGKEISAAGQTGPDLRPN